MTQDSCPYKTSLDSCQYYSLRYLIVALVIIYHKTLSPKPYCNYSIICTKYLFYFFRQLHSLSSSGRECIVSTAWIRDTLRYSIYLTVYYST